MRIQTNKTKLWRLARDYGAQPPMLKRTELICYESGSYGLAWLGRPKVYLFVTLGRPFLRIGKDFYRLTVDELRRRGMVKEEVRKHGKHDTAGGRDGADCAPR